METRRGLSLVLVVALLGSAFSVPVAPRLRRALDENELKETEDDEPLTYPPPVRQYFPDPVPPPPSVLKDIFGPPPPSSDSTAITSATSTTSSTSTSSTIRLDDDDDDDSDSDEFEPMNTSQTIGGGGSNLFSLLRLAGPLLSGSSGNEDGSDLATLLATVSGIVLNLSGDGVDVNALIASGLGLFVGLLSEGEENPGSILASYLLTSLDTLTGGGSENNGAFFGKFLSKLISGTSAGQSSSSESNSASGIFSNFKADIFRAVLQFAASLFGLASSTSSGASSASG